MRGNWRWINAKLEAHRGRKQAEEALRQAPSGTSHTPPQDSSMGELTARSRTKSSNRLRRFITNASTCLRWLARDDLVWRSVRASRQNGTRRKAPRTRSSTRCAALPATLQRELVDPTRLSRDDASTGTAKHEIRRTCSDGAGSDLLGSWEIACNCNKS